MVILIGKEINSAACSQILANHDDSNRYGGYRHLAQLLQLSENI
jgi:hypothetical protein